MAILPFVRQFANVDHAWFDVQPWPHLLRWLEELLDTPRFARVMAKYAKWQPDDAPIIFG